MHFETWFAQSYFFRCYRSKSLMQAYHTLRHAQITATVKSTYAIPRYTLCCTYWRNPTDGSTYLATYESHSNMAGNLYNTIPSYWVAWTDRLLQ